MKKIYLILFTIIAVAISGCKGADVAEEVNSGSLTPVVDVVDASETAEGTDQNKIQSDTVVQQEPVGPAIINILFTSDLHSHFESFEENGKVIGGYARLKTLIDENKSDDENDILVDCGDFTTGLSVTGSPYSQFYCSDAAELRMLGALGMQFTTFGNHELDFNLKGLEQMARAAEASNDILPEILVCNIDWDATETIYPGLKNQFEKIGHKSYKITEVSGKKVAVIGVIGQDAINWASDYNDMKFTNPVAAVRSTVDVINTNEDVDMIILLAHCGTNRLLAGVVNNDEVCSIIDAVPEIDVVVCGHTHMTFEEPIIYNGTPMIAPGNYGRNLGKVTFQENENDGTWNLLEYKLFPVTEDVKEDTVIWEKISEYKKKLE